MPLTDADRLLYSRHRLLPEIGDGGQLRLRDATITLPDDLTPDARAVALDYLRRAGVSSFAPEPAANLPRSPAPLHAAEAALVGAFAAVEAIKEVLGAGQPGRLDENPAHVTARPAH